MDLDPKDSGMLYDYEAERVFSDYETEALERWTMEWYAMGMRELLFYLEKHTRFDAYLRERGLA